MLDAVAHALTRYGEPLAALRSIASIRAAYDLLPPPEREVMVLVIGVISSQRERRRWL